MTKPTTLSRIVRGSSSISLPRKREIEEPLPPFIYETGPHDFFEPLVPFAQLLTMPGPDYDICSLMRAAFLVAKMTGWEGDISDGPYVFGLPDPDEANNRLGFVWKQRNNGATFVVSPVRIPWLEREPSPF